MKEGEDAAKSYESKAGDVVNQVTGIKSEITEGVKTAEQDVELVKRNAAAISSYGSTSK